MNNKFIKKLGKLCKRGIALTLCVTMLFPIISNPDCANAEEVQRVRGYAWNRAYGDDDMKALIEKAENNEINKNASETDVRILIVYDDKYFISGGSENLDEDGEFHGSQVPSSMKLDTPYFTTRKSYNTPFVKLDEDEPYNEPRGCYSFNINMSKKDEHGNEKAGNMWLYHENWNFPCIFTYFFTFRDSLWEGQDDDEGTFTMKSYREKDIQFEFNSFYERFDYRKILEDRMIDLYNTDDMTKLNTSQLRTLQFLADQDAHTYYYMAYWMYCEDNESYETLAKFLRDRRDAGEFVAWSPNSFSYLDIAFIVSGILTVLTFGMAAIITVPIMAGLGISIGLGYTSVFNGNEDGEEIVHSRGLANLAKINPKMPVCCGLPAGATGLGSSSHHEYNTGENYLPILADSDQNVSFFPSMDLLEDETLLYLSEEYESLTDEEKALADKAYKSDVSKHKKTFTDKWKEAAEGYIDDIDDTDHNNVPIGYTKLHYELSGRCDASWRWDGSRVYASSHETGVNAGFKIFIGEPTYLPTVTGNFRVYANQTKFLDSDINIGKGVVITVEKGGTLICRGRVYNEGIIICEGNLIIESGGCIADEFVYTTGNKETGRKYSGYDSPMTVAKGYEEQKASTVKKSVEEAVNREKERSKRGNSQKVQLTKEEEQHIRDTVTAQVSKEEDEAFASRFAAYPTFVWGNVQGYMRNEEYEDLYNAFIKNGDNSALEKIKEYGRMLPDGSIVIKNGGLFYIQEGALLMMSKDPTLKAYNGGNIIIDGMAACLALVEVDSNSNLEVGPTGELCIGATVDLEDERITADTSEQVYKNLREALHTTSLYTLLKEYDKQVLASTGALHDIDGSSQLHEGDSRLRENIGLKVTNESTLCVYGLLEMVDNCDVGAWSSNMECNSIDDSSVLIALDGYWATANTGCVGIARYQFSVQESGS